MINVYFERKPTTFMDWYTAIKAQYGGDVISIGFFAFLGWLKNPSKHWDTTCR